MFRHALLALLVSGAGAATLKSPPNKNVTIKSVSKTGLGKSRGKAQVNNLVKRKGSTEASHPGDRGVFPFGPKIEQPEMITFDASEMEPPSFPGMPTTTTEKPFVAPNITLPAHHGSGGHEEGAGGHEAGSNILTDLLKTHGLSPFETFGALFGMADPYRAPLHQAASIFDKARAYSPPGSEAFTPAMGPKRGANVNGEVDMNEPANQGGPSVAYGDQSAKKNVAFRNMPASHADLLESITHMKSLNDFVTKSAKTKRSLLQQEPTEDEGGWDITFYVLLTVCIFVAGWWAIKVGWHTRVAEGASEFAFSCKKWLSTTLKGGDKYSNVPDMENQTESSYDASERTSQTQSSKGALNSNLQGVIDRVKGTLEKEEASAQAASSGKGYSRQ